MSDTHTTPAEEGLSLTDIGTLRELVPVNGKMLAVYGVSAEGVLTLFNRFPELKAWALAGKINVSEIKAPDAIKAIIAAGCGQPGNVKAEAVAGTLTVETQLNVLEAIGRLTFTNGFGPFVNRIVALVARARSAVDGRAPVTTLHPMSKPLPQSGEAPNPS